MTRETLAFQTEVQKLLHLMIHSLYSNRDIFLRELVSNASDACDKLRVEAMGRDGHYQGDADLHIQIDFDTEAKTLTIRDNGIGMSRDEAVANLGTIARSGTQDFFSRLSGDQARDSSLIGQFGVGFYSAFIVADRVTVRSRRAGLLAEEGIRWESDGSGSFTIEQETLPTRGTEIVLHLRAKPEGQEDAPDHTDLLSQWTLKDILKRYSDHIALPIRMRKRRWDAEAQKEVVEDDWEAVNQANALWTRSKSEVSEDQAQEFYRSLAGGFGDDKALAWTLNRVEGRTEYTQMLFIPAKAPYDLFDREQRHGLKLYIKRVFILDDAKQLLPSYLRFVRGVVDSADLPLNVSREILQESRDIRAIREGCTKRILGLLEDLATNRPDDYKTFWAEFGQCFKEGFGEDIGNQARIAKLCRFHSSAVEGQEPETSLEAYVARMRPGQKSVYVLTADSLTAARTSPHLEIFRKKGIEVLLLADRIDEWVLGMFHEFEGHPLQSIAKGDLDLTGIEPVEGTDEDTTTAQPELDQAVLQRAQEVLGSRVSSVRVSQRLTESASCLVSQAQDVSGHLERLLKAAGQEVPSRRPILELNPQHPLVMAAGSPERLGEEGFADLVWMLHDQALLAEGGQPEDPAAFVRRMNHWIVRGVTAQST